MSRGQVTPYSSSGTALTINRELPHPGQVCGKGGGMGGVRRRGVSRKETRVECKLNCGDNCNRFNVMIEEKVNYKNKNLQSLVSVFSLGVFLLLRSDEYPR